MIRSKVPLMQHRGGERYLMVGPYEASKAGIEFEPSRPSGWLAKAVQKLAVEGLTVHYGRWLVPGRPARAAGGSQRACAATRRNRKPDPGSNTKIETPE